MLNVLRDILCAILNLGTVIIDLLMMMVNKLIEWVGFTLELLVSLLPIIPNEPLEIESGILAFLNFIVPVGPLLGMATTALALWVAFLVLSVALRWFKAL